MMRPTPGGTARRLLAVVLAVSVAPGASAVVGGYTPTADEYRFDAVAAFGKTNRLLGPVEYNNHFGAGTLIDCE